MAPPSPARSKNPILPSRARVAHTFLQTSAPPHSSNLLTTTNHQPPTFLPAPRPNHAPPAHRAHLFTNYQLPVSASAPFSLWLHRIPRAVINPPFQSRARSAHNPVIQAPAFAGVNSGRNTRSLKSVSKANTFLPSSPNPYPIFCHSNESWNLIRIIRPIKITSFLRRQEHTVP